MVNHGDDQDGQPHGSTRSCVGINRAVAVGLFFRHQNSLSGKTPITVEKRLLDRQDPFLWQRPTPMLLRADDLADECGEVTGSVQIAIEYEGALAAAECPFGQAQFGCHHATPQYQEFSV
jgi:hypothetical protein